MRGDLRPPDPQYKCPDCGGWYWDYNEKELCEDCQEDKSDIEYVVPSSYLGIGADGKNDTDR